MTKTKDIKKYMKQYKKTEQFKIRRKQLLRYYKCECGGRYTSEHITKHMNSKKHLKYNNKLLLEIIEEMRNMEETVDETATLPYPSDEDSDDELMTCPVEEILINDEDIELIDDSIDYDNFDWDEHILDLFDNMELDLDAPI